jgi:cytochrome c oxidase cbb3-type subunit 4
MITATAFITFVGIVWWAYSPSRKSRFDADARMPFEDEQ